ncbi:uncharacterized protein K441DRAFT_660794, partial [Cenococcum geophilum 1.58]|uniref:uncharacterized protein n=1 Tax=Cenococcum geophilum 1.58 TaxID=794803 RepID=UPI00358EC716
CCSNTVVGKGGDGGGMVGNRTGARAELQIRLDVTSEAQTKKSIADIGISAPSAKLI